MMSFSFKTNQNLKSLTYDVLVDNSKAEHNYFKHQQNDYAYSVLLKQQQHYNNRRVLTTTHQGQQALRLSNRTTIS